MMISLEIEQDGPRIRALIRSAKDKIRSALAVTENVAHVLTAEEFIDWCYNHAKCGPEFLSRLNGVLVTLRDSENQQAKESLKLAKEEEKKRKQAEKEQQAQQAHERMLADEERKRQAALAKTATAEAEIAASKAVRAKEKQRERQPIATPSARVSEARKVAISPTASLRDLAAGINKALKAMRQSGLVWNRGVITVAELLCKARERFPSNTQFGEWCAANIPDINKNDRAAYLQLGRDPERVKAFLETTESRSIQLIGRDFLAARKTEIENDNNIIALARTDS
jgi:flagellar biosynthesis GTPase FlhF